MEAWSLNHWTPGKSLPSAHKDIDLKFSCLKEHPFLPLSLVPQLIDLQMLELQGSIFDICLSAPLGGKVPRLFPECQTWAFNCPLYSGSASQILHFQNRILDFLSPKFAPGSPYQWMISLFFQVLKWRTRVILDSSSNHQIPMCSPLWIYLESDHLHCCLSDPNPITSHLGHMKSANRASCSWSWSKQPLEEPFWDIRRAWAPLYSKPSDDSHLTQSKIHSSYHGPQALISDPLTPVTSSSMTLVLAYPASGTLSSLLLLQHTRTHLAHIPWSSLGASVLPSTCLERFPPEELQESPLHISFGMSSNVIHQESFP